MNQKEREFFERLKAEVEAADGDPADLGIVFKSDYQATQEENESLRERNEALEAEVEEVKQQYADSLAEAHGLDTSLFLEKDLEELKQLHEESQAKLVDTPRPKSGDITQNSRVASLSADKRKEVEKLEAQIEKFEERGGIWAGVAEDYREELNSLL